MSALDHHEEPEFRFLRAIWELEHALESASRGMKKAFGVTGRERLFVRLVGQRPGVAPGELAEVLHVHPSSVTALVKRLERRRLVVRRPSATDGRSFGLALTPAGERIDAMRTGTIEAGVRHALSGAPARDVELASELVARVARRLEAWPLTRRAGPAPSRRGPGTEGSAARGDRARGGSSAAGGAGSP
ncbi:MAG TPA: MarR family transcriptional regulator [Anaeromyxobacteraceae bacterium]|nr:MarR family transcriptional regulator [Anaeromyxobacteraceae bacterium]